ncbi:hypothetical protein HAX54_046076, partial [Datura stramonium]|nr:hypothetical protein [Datura stramonium]
AIVQPTVGTASLNHRKSTRERRPPAWIRDFVQPATAKPPNRVHSCLYPLFVVLNYASFSVDY